MDAVLAAGISWERTVMVGLKVVAARSSPVRAV